nr:cupin domain-containing protein [Mesorhizobium sp. M4B.F.Ca.ET.058.02.1.1]
MPRDELCHFVSGRATYKSDDSEVIEVTAGTVVLFPAGWSGECTVHKTMRNIYMLA